LRILSVVSSFFPYRGGSGLGHYDVLKRLANKYNYNVDVITYNYGNTNKTIMETVSGIDVYRMSCWARDGFVTIPKPTYKNLLLILGLTFNRKHDLVYTRARYSPPTSLGTLLSIIKRIPHLHTEVSIALPGNRPHWYSEIFAGVMDATLGKIITNGATCVAVSKEAAKSMRKIGVKRPHVIYNGVDKEVFHP